MSGKKGMKHAKRLDDSSIDRIRYRILQSKIANRLMDHINGELEMSNSQVNAAMGLLRKVMPDLSATELSGNITHFSDALERIAKLRKSSDVAVLSPDRSVIEQPIDSVIH